MKFNVGDRIVVPDYTFPGIVTMTETYEENEWYSVLHTNGSTGSYMADEIRAYDPDMDGDFNISDIVNIMLFSTYDRQAEPVKQLKICAEFNGICIHDHEAKEKRITVNVAEVVAVSESVIDVLGNTVIDVGNGTRFYVKETYDEVRNAIGWEV